MKTGLKLLQTNRFRGQCSIRLYVRRPAGRGWACSSCSGSWPAGWAGDPLWLQRNTTCRQNRQTARQQRYYSSGRAGGAANLTWTRWTGSRWSLRRWTEPRRSAWWRRTSPATSLQTSEEQNDRRTQWRGRVRLQIRTLTYCLILCRKTCYVDELESYKIQKTLKAHRRQTWWCEHIISFLPLRVSEQSVQSRTFRRS